MFVGAAVGGLFVTGALVGGRFVLVDAGVLVGAEVAVRVGLAVALGRVVAVGKELTRVAAGVTVAWLLCGLRAKKSVPPIRTHPRMAMPPAKRSGAIDERGRFCVIVFSHKRPESLTGRDYSCCKTGPQHTAARGVHPKSVRQQ